MRIVIRGGGFYNKGAEAMLRTTQVELGRRLEVARFVVRLQACYVPQADSSGLDLDVAAPGRLKKMLYLLPGLCRRDIRSALQVSPTAALQVHRAGEFDGVVDISGFSYTDVSGAAGAKQSLGWIKACQHRRNPYVFLPQAWGPFTNPTLDGLVREICTRSGFVYARDEESCGYLSGIAKGGFAPVLAPDIAFLFAGEPPEVGVATLAARGIVPRERSILAITPNMRVYERSEGTGAGNHYVQCLLRIAKACMESFDCAIALVPFEISCDGGKDDRYLCRMLAEMLGSKHAVAFTDTYSAGTLKSLLGQCDLVVGSRFHSLVLALGTGVPVVALGWSHKYPALLELFDLARFACGLDDMGAVAEGMVSDAWIRRESTRHIIEQRLPAIQSRVAEVFDHVGRVLRAGIDA